MNLDSHQHFWRYTSADYGWIGPGMEVLKRDRMPNDLHPHLASLGLDGTVAVQARQSLEETQWLLDLADQHPFVKGVVGWVDLRSPDVHEHLEQFSAHPRFCGVRHVLQDEPNDQFMLGTAFLRGIAALAKFDLRYDVLIFPRHLPTACELVKRFPDQPFVLDHMAKPMIKAGLIAPWDTDLRKLASYTNVSCKVSGLVTEADWQGWRPSDLTPYLDVVFELFGADRLMFGSDWPVCTVAGTYSDIAAVLADYVQALSESERASVWGQTAQRFYGLT
jgi:L-fuconolactonase